MGVLDRFSTRDRLIVILGLNTGFRLAELLALRIAHVWDGERVRGKLRIERRHMKLGRGVRRRKVSSRAVPINAIAGEAIAEHLGRIGRTGRLAPEMPLLCSEQRDAPISAMQATRILRRVFRTAGIADLAQLSSHSLRKTFALRIMSMSGNNLEVTRAALGHRSIATTQIYVAVSEREAMDLVVEMGRVATSGGRLDYLGGARGAAAR